MKTLPDRDRIRKNKEDITTHMTSKIIEVKELKKSYGDVQAVKGISFYVNQGGLFAFLGPNGAGKSTTIDMLCTLLQADGGEVTIDGHVLGREDGKIRSGIGVVFQDSVLDPLLTVKENLYCRGSFYGLPADKLKQAVMNAAQYAGVTEFINRPYGKLSGGQRRRADIARALVNQPKILFLDEPTTGLDPQTRKNIWDTIQNLQKENNLTVFLTTHYMEEAASADYVIVIDKGEIAANGTPDELKSRYSSDVLKLSSDDPKAVTAMLDAENVKYEIRSGIIKINLENTLEAVPIVEKCKGCIKNVEILNGTMDDAFIGITGKEIRG